MRGLRASAFTSLDFWRSTIWLPFTKYKDHVNARKLPCLGYADFVSLTFDLLFSTLFFELCDTGNLYVVPGFLEPAQDRQMDR